MLGEIKSIGEELKIQRKVKGLSLREVESAIGISNAYLSQLETGKIKKPSFFILNKLAGFYNIDLKQLTPFVLNPEVLKQHSTSDNTIYGLTKEEKRELEMYLIFLRQYKNKC